MELETTICVIAHHLSQAETDLSAGPWFQLLNSHREQSAYPGFAVSIGIAMYLVEAQKS